MKKLLLILVVLLLAVIAVTALADSATDPGAGKPTVPMPGNTSFDDPSILVPGTFYRGEKDKAYQMAFTPPVTGTYTVYGKTDGEYGLQIEILDDYKKNIGWVFDNNNVRVPKEWNVDLEAGKTYHFSGVFRGGIWARNGEGTFTFALYPTDFSTGTIGMPAMTAFENPCKIKTNIIYQGVKETNYQLQFIPEVSGSYLVYAETDNTSDLSFTIIDQNKQNIGWYFNNGGKMGPVYHAVELKAGEKYYFVGGRNITHSRWTNGTFSFSISPIDDNETERVMSAMVNFENPATIKTDVIYHGVKEVNYQLQFIPKVTGSYLVYAETDNTSDLSFTIIDQNKQNIGWYFNNGGKMGPVYHAVELKAGEKYYFVGGRNITHSRWTNGTFSFSISHIDDNATEQVMPAMVDIKNSAHLKENIKYNGSGSIAYKQFFVPDKDGIYTVTISNNDKTEVNIKAIDQYRQDVGWSMNNGGAIGNRVKNIALKAGTEYYFIGTRSSENWSNGAFTFSIAPAAGDTANLLPAMWQYTNPATVAAGILYRGDAGDAYELVFTPADTGLYTVYAKTEESKDFSIKVLNEYKETIGWKLYNGGKQTPAISSMELEAGREYHFTGDLSNAVWSKATFEFAICAPSKHAGSLSDFQTVQEPTCTEAGFSAQLCTLCQQPVNRQEIAAKGHTAGEPVVHQPTCVENGVQITQCTVCGAEISREEIPATGHTPGEPIVYQKATCLVPGLKITQCTVCGAEVEREEIPTTGHQPGAWTELKPATCTAAGQRVQRCTVCGAELAKEEIPATGHTPGAWVDLKSATCTADGQRVQRCATCGETLKTETVPAFGHSPMDWQVTREAACLQSGLKEKKCSVCGVSLEQEEIPALGHSYTEWETTIEPTKDAEGERTRHCVHCGETQQEPVEKLGRFLGIF